jgi:hypothetical protein
MRAVLPFLVMLGILTKYHPFKLPSPIAFWKPLSSHELGFVGAEGLDRPSFRPIEHSLSLQ